MAQLTTAEIENLRFHLGYGNLQVGAYPWTPDGFMELFTNVIGPYLSTGPETSSTTAIDASAGPALVVVTPLDMTGIAPNVRLVVDNGDEAEVVVVKAAGGATFVAKYLLSHAASGYPIAVETGTARLRMLLHQADRVHAQLVGPETTAVAGVHSADKGEVVWLGPNAVLKGVLAHYETVIGELGRLTRVQPVGVRSGGPVTRMEAY